MSAKDVISSDGYENYLLVALVPLRPLSARLAGVGKEKFKHHLSSNSGNS